MLARLDDTTLEVEVSKDIGMNALFAGLAAHGIEVLSLRNKSNRLEELFIRLVESGAVESGAEARAAGTPA